MNIRGLTARSRNEIAARDETASTVPHCGPTFTRDLPSLGSLVLLIAYFAKTFTSISLLGGNSSRWKLEPFVNY